MHRLALVCCLLVSAASARAIGPIGPIEPLGRWDMPADRGVAAVLQADGTRVLVGADDTDGHVPGGWVWVLDLDDPAAPIQRAEFALSSVPTDIAVKGDLAAVVRYHALNDSGALVLIDLSDPLQPGIVSESSFSGEPTAVAWLPPYAVIAIRSSDTGRLLIVDTSDPVHPWTADILLVYAAPVAMSVGGGLLYLSEENDYSAYIEWFDTTDPTAMTLVERWGLTLRFAELDIQDERLHALHESGTYVLIDLSGPGLWYRGVVDLPPLPGGLTHQGDAVYAATGDSLTIIGAGDPDHPFTADTFVVDTAVDVGLGRGYCGLLDATGLWTLPLYTGPTPVTVSGFTATAEGTMAILRWRRRRSRPTTSRWRAHCPGAPGLWPSCPVPTACSRPTTRCPGWGRSTIDCSCGTGISASWWRRHPCRSRRRPSRSARPSRTPSIHP